MGFAPEMRSREELLGFLGKVLAAERTGGFRDRAVLGGLARLAETLAAWEAEAGQSSGLPGGFAKELTAYRRRTASARARAVAALEAWLAFSVRAPPVDRAPIETSKEEGSRVEGRGSRGEGARASDGPNRAEVDPVGARAGARRAAPSVDVRPVRESKEPPNEVRLSSPVTALRGVKEERARLLARIGVRTVEDLLFLLPQRYEDRSAVVPIASLLASARGRLEEPHSLRSHRPEPSTLNPRPPTGLSSGQPATIHARVERVSTVPMGPRRERLEARLTDESGSIDAVWFNQPWMARVVRQGECARFHGLVREREGRLQLTSPEVERPGSKEHRFVPVYPLTEGLFQKGVARWVDEALRRCGALVTESLPEELATRLELPGPAAALAEIHQPVLVPAPSVDRAWHRLRFEELYFLELAVAVKRHLFTVARPGVAIEPSRDQLERFRAELGFVLTTAQERAVSEILSDLRRPRAMARLLQGDVGSGKTAVAMAAVVAAASAGYQSAVMAPTEILAGQHFLAMRRLCGELGVQVELVTGSQGSRERRAALDAIASGRGGVAVGTHALLEGGVEFARLGLVVIDEQHRFGVNQRARLKLKGENPNLLVMTATPIPRTLSLTLYGDLDLSVLDEMPPGRRPIVTEALPMKRVGDAYARIREEVGAGRQAYVVCPLVEESETLQVEAAESAYDEVRETWLSGLAIRLLHGRMTGAQKAAAMEAMRRREADVLVSTTVIEVGVDIPNATVMAVLNSERFGLAQLHQLRGRVGRGGHASWFHPVYASSSASVSERMAVLEETCDGFVVAERDLELRGPGEFFGTRQSGLDALRFAELPRDFVVLEQARREAFALVERDPGLAGSGLARTRAALLQRYGEFVNRRH